MSKKLNTKGSASKSTGNPIGPKPRKNPLTKSGSKSVTKKLSDNSMTFESESVTNGGYMITVTMHRNNNRRVFFASSPQEKQRIIDTVSRGERV